MSPGVRTERAIPGLSPVRSRTKGRLYEDVIAYVKAEIAAGRLAPGDRLPSERELTESLGVSRTALREAMSALQASGLVEVRQGYGVIVRALSLADLVEPMSLLLLTTPANLSQLLELRRGLEGEAAYLAARRATAEDRQRIADAMAAAERDVAAGGTGKQYDYDFHSAIIRGSHNPLYMRFLGIVHELFQRGIRQLQQGAPHEGGNPRMVLEQHRNIWTAISEWNGAAARAAMWSHLDSISAALGEVRLTTKGVESVGPGLEESGRDPFPDSQR